MASTLPPRRAAIFDIQSEVTQDQCNAYAESLTQSLVKPMGFQGANSYTVVSDSSPPLVVQFRIKDSSLVLGVVNLAKQIYGAKAPLTMFVGYMAGSNIAIWTMECIPGISYVFDHKSRTPTKVEASVTDLARYGL